MAEEPADRGQAPPGSGMRIASEQPPARSNSGRATRRSTLCWAVAFRDVEHLREAPVVLISAGARPTRSIPRVTFVPKPFDLDRMVNLVETKIGRPGDYV